MTSIAMQKGEERGRMFSIPKIRGIATINRAKRLTV
jgi:hypothetical protein